jgi:hypothetical protein
LIKKYQEIVGRSDDFAVAWNFQISAFHHLGARDQNLCIGPIPRKRLDVNLYWHAGIGIGNGTKHHIGIVQFVNFVQIVERR